MRGAGWRRSRRLRADVEVDVEMSKQRHPTQPDPARGSLIGSSSMGVRQRTRACLFGPADERHLHGL